jgi:UDP-N-acetyl-D-mannosaminuronic acid dehydrogenase
MSQKIIIVVGTGYIGLPAALMWAKAGETVVGVDIDDNVVRAINDGTMRLNEAEVRDLFKDPIVKKNLVVRHCPCPGDVFVIAVPTPIDPQKKMCDLSAVRAAIEAIGPHLVTGNLVIVESTIPPNTTRTVIKPLIEKITKLKVPEDVLLAHCPERILPGDIFREIVENDRLIGGIDGRSAAAAAAVYMSFVKGQLLEIDDISAELSKLMENTYRDVNIALANEFAQLCELFDTNPRKVISFANRHPRVNILNPGIGVGGHCIPVDPWFLKEVAPYNSRLIAVARLINDEMPQRIAAKIRKLVADIDRPRILALGATYKQNCDDLRESPALQIVHMLKEDGYQVEHYDPLIGNMRYSSLTAAASRADLIAVLVYHDVLKREFAQNRVEIESAMRHQRVVFFDE